MSPWHLENLHRLSLLQLALHPGCWAFLEDNSSGKPKQNICDGANTHRLTPGEHATIPPVSYTQIVCLERLTLPFWVMMPGTLLVSSLFQLQCPLCFSMPSTKPPTTTRWCFRLLITEVLPKGTALRWSINPLAQTFSLEVVFWGEDLPNILHPSTLPEDLQEILEINSPKILTQKLKSCQMQWKAGPINFHKPTLLKM